MKFLTTAFLLGVLLIGCVFSQKKSLEYFEKGVEKAPYDAIIVPGVPYDGDSWSIIMESRVMWANYLYNKGIANNIIFSGGAVYSKFYEAKIMAEYGKALGIPSSNIFVDTNAEHSSENVYYSYLIAKELGFSKIALATDPFQAKSLKVMIDKISLPIDLLPILYDTLERVELPEPSISSETAIKDSFVSITDRESFYTRIQGTFGKHIMWHEEDLPDEKTVRKYRRKGRLIEKE